MNFVSMSCIMYCPSLRMCVRVLKEKKKNQDLTNLRITDLKNERGLDPNFTPYLTDGVERYLGQRPKSRSRIDKV